MDFETNQGVHHRVGELYQSTTLRKNAYDRMFEKEISHTANRQRQL